MGSLMDLVAGDARDIVLALSVDDVAAFDDPDRFVAHLPLGGGLDPTWLDLFSEAVRSVTEQAYPVDFLDARSELGDGADVERIVELVDPAWISAVAGVPEDQLSALAGRWIGLLEEELGLLPREEKPWIRDLTGQIVAFARRSDRAPDVVFAWAF
jgi:anaerobic selenocysteine-containing dehydrogenase